MKIQDGRSEKKVTSFPMRAFPWLDDFDRTPARFYSVAWRKGRCPAKEKLFEDFIGILVPIFLCRCIIIAVDKQCWQKVATASYWKCKCCWKIIHVCRDEKLKFVLTELSAFSEKYISYERHFRRNYLNYRSLSNADSYKNFSQKARYSVKSKHSLNYQPQIFAQTFASNVCSAFSYVKWKLDMYRSWVTLIS